MLSTFVQIGTSRVYIVGGIKMNGYQNAYIG